MQMEMRRIWAVIVLVIGVQAVCAPDAQAQWTAKVTGPDVFGSTTVVAVVSSVTHNGLVIQCDDKDSLEMANIFPATISEMDNMSKIDAGLPAKLFVKVDQGPVKIFDARLRTWNNTYLAFAASERTSDMVALVRSIGAAKSGISIGTEINGHRQSESFGSIGSTNAINTLIKGCKLDDVKP
jgi:hypothetical protein